MDILVDLCFWHPFVCVIFNYPGSKVGVSINPWLVQVQRLSVSLYI